MNQSTISTERLEYNYSYEDDISSSGGGVVSSDILHLLMTTPTLDGMNLLEKCFFILYERKDERFLMYVLKWVPNVDRYLYVVNKDGWLPIFRVLNLFKTQLYESDQGWRTRRMAQDLLDVLYDLNYDFLRPSGLEYNGHANIDTYCMILF